MRAIPHPERSIVHQAIFVVAALLCLLAAAPARAQDHDGSIGYGGGGIWFGDFDDRGTLALDPGWLVDAHAERWYLSRLGVRVHGAFTQRPLQTPQDTREIRTWLLDAGVVLRLLPARPGRAVAPFLSLGGGVVSYELGRGTRLAIEEDLVYPGDTNRQLAGVAGLGIDFLPRWSLLDTRLGVRLEVADHVVLKSPFESAAGESFGPIHNLRLTLSLLGLVDLFP
jgi:hypothetical protein